MEKGIINLLRKTRSVIHAKHDMGVSVKRALFLIVIVIILTLTGCDSFVEVTPEQHAQIVEYSAALLLKYDRFYESNLVPIALPTPKPEIIEVIIPEPEAAEEVEETASSAGSNRPEIIDNTVPKDLTAVFDIDGLEFHYAGFLVADRYPEAVPGEVYLFVDSSPGHNLLVLKFQVINRSSSDIYLDMNEYSLRTRIGYNGENISGSLFTMLLDDFSFFKDVIPAGETVELSSISETGIVDAAEIHSIEFLIRSEAGNFTFNY